MGAQIAINSHQINIKKKVGFLINNFTKSISLVLLSPFLTRVFPNRFKLLLLK